jgi:hypothetical protein
MPLLPALDPIALFVLAFFRGVPGAEDVELEIIREQSRSATPFFARDELAEVSDKSGS